MRGAWLALNVACVAGLLDSEDWLVARPPRESTFETLDDGSLRLSNGLISRTFVTSPNWATVSLRVEAPSYGSAQELLRGLSPEARLNVSCANRRRLLPYAPDALLGMTDPNMSGSSPGSAGQAVGGLRGQKRFALLDLPQWNLTAGDDDWQYDYHEVGPIQARWAWTPGQRHSAVADWPPKGLQLKVHFYPPDACGCSCGLTATVVYEIYDDVPTIAKRVEVSAAAGTGREAVLVETLVTEELHVGEAAKRRIHVETDYMPRKTFWRFAQVPAADPGTGMYAGQYMNYPAWWIDPDYELDEHDETLHADVGSVALLLQVQYPLGPWQPIAPGESVEFFTLYLTLFDADDALRQSLARRRVVRTLFPQTTEAPLYFYTTNATSAGVRHTADQAAQAGFEGMLLSFGSGFDPSSTDPAYIARVRNDTEYARSKGLMLGGYTLMQNPPGLDRQTRPDDFCRDPDGAEYAHIADFTTDFHRQYRENIVAFLKATTMEMLETDGPYEGATCAPTANSGFAHVNNSQLAQYKVTVDFYRDLKREVNTFNTVPDPYWSSGGTNKEPMGYTDEWNGLPHTEAGLYEYLAIGRMYLADGTWHKPTTMGWMAFEMSRKEDVPTARYTRLFEEALASYLGQGNVACYRGPELYDAATPQLAKLWALWIAHYKRYRPILMADVITVIRPTGASIEAALHVNASAGAGEPCAFVNLFNPTPRALTQTIDLPVYYAGLRRGGGVAISWGGSLLAPDLWPVPSPMLEPVRDDYNVRVHVSMAAKSFLWATLVAA